MIILILVAVVLGVLGVQAHGEDRVMYGLMGAWSMEDGTGTTLEDIGGSHDGTFNSSPQWVADGVVNQDNTSTGALSFDGIDDYVEMPGTSDWHFTSGFTLSAWVKFNEDNSMNTIVGRHLSGVVNGYFLSVRNNCFAFYFCGDWILSPLTYKDNLWHYVVGVYNGTQYSLYVDGNLVNGPTNRAYSFLSYAYLRIGAGTEGGGGIGAFKGKIDEVKVYNRALTQDDIDKQYDLGANKFIWIPGDANHDGIVGLQDLSTLASHYGEGPGKVWEEGDFNEDGYVNLVDQSILASNYGYGD